MGCDEMIMFVRGSRFFQKTATVELVDMACVAKEKLNGERFTKFGISTLDKVLERICQPEFIMYGESGASKEVSSASGVSLSIRCIDPQKKSFRIEFTEYIPPSSLELLELNENIKSLK